MFADNVFERYRVKRIALRQSPCGIPRVVKVCSFVILFFTCSVTSFRRILIMFNSSESRMSEKKFIQMLSVDGVKSLCHIKQQNVS